MCRAGNFEEAKKAHDAFLPLMDELFVTANPIMVKDSSHLFLASLLVVFVCLWLMQQKNNLRI